MQVASSVSFFPGFTLLFNTQKNKKNTAITQQETEILDCKF
jgi:hypothetical protein